MNWSEWVEKGVNILKGLIPEIKTALAGRDLNININIANKIYKTSLPEKSDIETVKRIASSPEFERIIEQKFRDYVAPYEPRYPKLSAYQKDKVIVDAVNSSMSSAFSVAFDSVPPSKSDYHPEDGEGSGIGVSVGECDNMESSYPYAPPKKPYGSEGETM